MSAKIDQSIRIIKRLYNPDKPYICAFSGGKDSIVIYDLCKKSGLPIIYIYSNTTIDPPGHLRFIKENYLDVQIVQPKRSFYQVVERYGLPTRHRRFCCQHLKEYVGKNANVIEGLRIDEGIKRGKRLKELKEPESCDKKIKGKKHIYPILNWTEKNIWDYIYANKLPYSDWYNKGFKRLGCIGCPLASQSQRLKQYRLLPRYAYATIKAIDKNIKAGRSLSKFFNNPHEAFYWWISEQSIKSHKRLTLFEIDYEKEINRILKGCI
jgi:phosphoadenosine phosphosulfate reductase